MTDKTKLWGALGKTDPAHTKAFNRAGGFKGTAVKPMWVMQRLTEEFGPCGIGWGVGEPQFQIVPAGGDVLVYCSVSCWHGSKENVLWGVGGDKVSTQRSSGTFNDDEACKKAFTDAISGDWGGKPLEDLQKGLAAASQQFDWIDRQHACALGASYGGYMMNWIAGKWPNGFKCLVNHAGAFDTRAMAYSTEELWFTEWEYGGTYYQASANHEKVNPANFVNNWKTPMFVTQGERDFRIPSMQSLGAFTALQRRGIESQLLIFPDENHHILKPANSLQWHHAVLDWLGKHLR